MAIDLAAHRDHKELNSKLPSKEFIKKYKWWLVGGLVLGLIAFMYFRNKSSSSGSSSATGVNAGTGAVDPNTGIPYATELAQAQNASGIGSGTLGGGSSGSSSDGSSGTSGGSSTVTGTPSTSPTVTPTVPPTVTPATPPTTTPATPISPGNPPSHRQPARVKRHPPPVRHPGNPVTVQHATALPAIKKLGFPSTVTS